MGLMNDDFLHQSYLNKKFTDVFPDVETFLSEIANAGIPKLVTDEEATTIFYLLYARYGNSVIASSDETQFKYQLWSTIFQYGPTWAKELDIQKEIRNLTAADILAGSTQIANHSFNPSTEPSTSTIDELSTINEQHTNKWRKSKLEGYALQISLLKRDVTEAFISKFRWLFTAFMPNTPLYYETETNNENPY